MKHNWNAYLVGAALVGLGISIGVAGTTFELRNLAWENKSLRASVKDLNQVIYDYVERYPRFQASRDSVNWEPVFTDVPNSRNLLYNLSYWDSASYQMRVVVGDLAFNLCRLPPNMPYPWRVTNK